MESEKQITKIADLFDSTGKIITLVVLVVAFVANVAIAWYKMGDTANDVTSIKHEITHMAEDEESKIKNGELEIDALREVVSQQAKELSYTHSEVDLLKDIVFNFITKNK